MEKIKIKIDEAKAELQRKESQIKENKQVAEALLQKIQLKIKEKEQIERGEMKQRIKHETKKEPKQNMTE